MSTHKNRELGMFRDIMRRDFVNGVGAAVGGALSGLSAAYFFLTSAGSGARVLALNRR